MRGTWRSGEMPASHLSARVRDSKFASGASGRPSASQLWIQPNA